MAQIITPALQTLLEESKLFVGTDKPRGEIEIDVVTGHQATGSPLLASNANGTASEVSEWDLPSVSPSGDNVLLIAVVVVRPIRTIVAPAGWDLIASKDFAAGNDRTAWYRKAVASASGPYADTFEVTGGAAKWGAAQLAFRTTESQPDNKDVQQSTYACTTNPTRSATLGVAPDVGHVVLAFGKANGCGPSGYVYSGSQDFGWSAGFTDLLLMTIPASFPALGVAYRVADGTPTDESVTATWHSDNTKELTTLIVEVAIDPEPEPAIDTKTYQVGTMGFDRSRKMAAAQLDATLPNEAGDLGWYTGDGLTVVPNNPVRAYAWYGDRANRVRVFTGLFDRIHEHRNPKTLSLKARSRAKWLLAPHTFRATAPQGADEDGAVRTEANGVFIDKTIAYIVGKILDMAGWPAADRVIDPPDITLAEYVLADGEDWASQIAGADRLTTAAGCDFWEDELGLAHFEPSPLVAAVEPTPAWAFAAGVNVLALDHEVDDEDRVTRVEVSGPMTTSVPKWEQLWQTSVLDYPAGIWYDPADPDYLRVIDRVTKYIYRLRQSDRKIVSKALLGGYPLGLSGIPGDPDHYLVLSAPWRNTGSTSGNRLKKYAKATNALVASYGLPNGRWTAMKSDGTNVFLTNYDDGKIYKRTMTGGAVSSHSTTYDGELQTRPTGLWINGATMGVFFAGPSLIKRFLLMDTSAIGTVTGRQSTKGTAIAGGESDTDTDIHLYAGTDKGSLGSTAGYVRKFVLAELVETDVAASAIDYDLEDALGFQSGIGARDHGACPNVVGDHQFEIRQADYAMKVVQSLEQAQDVADAQLALLSRLRRVMDIATTGHPGVQINDPVGYTDAPAGIDGTTWVIDSYRKQIGATYTQTMSVLPWEAP